MPIALLGQVKAKLGIPASDTSRDAELDLLLTAAEGRVLDATRFSLFAEPRVETFLNVREGELVRTARRPIDVLLPVVVEGRDNGSSQWIALIADVVDPDRGKIRVAGASLGLGWPPNRREFPLSRAFRWRATEWPVVRTSYTTGIAVINEDLSDVAATLAALWDRAGGSVGLVSTTAGDVSETYATGGVGLAIPPVIAARLVPYMDGLVRATR